MTKDFVTFTIITLIGISVTACRNLSLPAAAGPANENVRLATDKSDYARGDTISVTLKNNTRTPVFLEGCNQIYRATKRDTGWVERVLWNCVWEGIAVQVEAGGKFALELPAGASGTYRFFSPVYSGCTAGEPISQADCASVERLYSREFVVR